MYINFNCSILPWIVLFLSGALLVSLFTLYLVTKKYYKIISFKLNIAPMGASFEFDKEKHLEVIKEAVLKADRLEKENEKLREKNSSITFGAVIILVIMIIALKLHLIRRKNVIPG